MGEGFASDLAGTLREVMPRQPRPRTAAAHPESEFRMSDEDTGPTSEYDASDPSGYTLEECEAAIGRRATLSLTGRIIAAGQSSTGPYVKFELDPRWGFRSGPFVMDLDPFDLS